jgi:2',3'-cyclic-nucleotide 2'-phosphodiesterase
MHLPPTPAPTPPDNAIRILFLGDVVGEPGRKAIADKLESIKEARAVDFVIVNGENAAGGKGLTPRLAIDLMRQGATVVTTGDHVWDQRELLPWIDTEPRVLRPANWPSDTPGQGFVVLDTKKGPVAVVNLLGRVFIHTTLEHPFRVIDALVEEIRQQTPVIFLDFHAEATSEKWAMGRFLDGRVSVVVGTHTHVATADTCILPGGTGYQTDAGMCGPEEGVIGTASGPVIERFLTSLPQRFEIARGAAWLNGVLADVDTTTGKTIAIERIHEYWAGAEGNESTSVS